MPKFEIELDEKTLRRAERYAASHDLTIEAVVANMLQGRANRTIRRRDWEPFETPAGIVRLILLIAWDPIDVAGLSGAMDEYDTYAEDIIALLEAGATAEELTAHLRGIERDWMNIKRERPDLPAVAAKLRHVYDRASAI